MSSEQEIVRLKLKKLELLEKEARERDSLPHIYLYKHYKWSRKFLDSRKKLLCLTAANQVSKSSCHIRKFIHWATEPEIWPGLWPKLQPGTKPRQWWYLYPNRETATIEFHDKWMQFLPKVAESDPKYGWRKELKNKLIHSISFNTGITIIFKAYSQDVQDLQAGSVYLIGCDEELPWELFHELSMRTAATDGYMSFVFTATKGQQEWREVVEDRTRLPAAEVMQVSMYDCLEYEDGTSTHWSKERIEEIKTRCATEAEIQKRVYGRFVMAEGLKYPAYDERNHSQDYHMVPSNWDYYACIDYGSGGTSGHPAAVGVVAVSPDFKSGRVVRAWRGDGVDTTCEDVILKYLEIIKTLPREPIASYYDWGAKDLKIIADRMGLTLQPAEKGHEFGVSVVNTLFKGGMLKLYRWNPAAKFPEDFLQTEKLSRELQSLSLTTSKQHAKDDLIDACVRYPCAKIPWDWTGIAPVGIALQPKILTEEEIRRGSEQKDMELNLEEEFEFWNDCIDG